MKQVVYLILISSLLACQSNTQQKSSTSKDSLSQEAKVVSDSTQACSWLKQNVEAYFKNEDVDKIQDITTPDYYEYKLDAINVDMLVDGSLTEEQFQKKWGSKYDTKYVGLNQGFLISGQDWGSIVVSTCDVIKEDEKSITLKSVISDCEYQTDYHREIVLEKANNSFKIKDVREFD